MSNHFRTAVLTVILAGGTLVSYATAYTMMGQAEPSVAIAGAEPVRIAVSGAVAERLVSGRTDVSVREACSTFERSGPRSRCMQVIAGAPRPVRVIDFASATDTVIR